MLPKGFKTKIMEILQGVAKLAQAVSPNCRPPLETPELFFLPSVEEVGPAELPPPQQEVFYLARLFKYDLIFGFFSYKEETLSLSMSYNRFEKKTKVVFALVIHFSFRLKSKAHHLLLQPVCLQLQHLKPAKFNCDD